MVSSICKHCFREYKYDPRLQPKEAGDFCSYQCMRCQTTKQEEFWYQPCMKHMEDAKQYNKHRVN